MLLVTNNPITMKNLLLAAGIAALLATDVSAQGSRTGNTNTNTGNSDGMQMTQDTSMRRNGRHTDRTNNRRDTDNGRTNRNRNTGTDRDNGMRSGADTSGMGNTTNGTGGTNTNRP